MNPDKQIITMVFDEIHLDCVHWTYCWKTRHVQGICDELAKIAKRIHGLDVDPLTDIVICCGQTEAFAAAVFSGTCLFMFLYRDSVQSSVVCGMILMVFLFGSDKPWWRSCNFQSIFWHIRKCCIHCWRSSSKLTVLLINISWRIDFSDCWNWFWTQNGQVYVTLDPPNWTLDPNKLLKSFTSRTKAIVLNR